MGGDRVVIVDSLRLQTELLDPWLERWERDYRPSAQARGLRLRGLWVGFSEMPGESVVMICWSAARPGRFWAARWAGTEDAQTLAFWVATDEVAIERDRRVMENWAG